MSNATPKNALIVGCGYLGRAVGKLLVARGTKVAATTTREARLAELQAAGFEPALLDVGKEIDRTRGAESPPGLFAAEMVLYAVAPGRDTEPRVAFLDGALRAARAFLEAGAVRRSFIYISSTGVYGQRDGSRVDEASPAAPTEARYRFLLQAEEALLEMARSAGLPLAILRLGGLYGPGRSPLDWLRSPPRRERLLRGGKEAYMNWVRVEDAAAAVLLAAEKARPGESYLIVDDEPVERGEFYRLAAQVAGLPPLELRADPRDLGKRCLNAKARRELGFEPAYPTYREGLGSL